MKDSKAGSKGSKHGHSSPGAITLRETVDSMMKAGAPCDTLAIDRSGRSVLDVAAGFDQQLMHHMLLNCDLKPADALFLAIKHGGTLVTEVIPRTCPNCNYTECTSRSFCRLNLNFPSSLRRCRRSHAQNTPLNRVDGHRSALCNLVGRGARVPA